MSTFPNKLSNRAAATIAKTARLVNTAHQRINALGSQVSTLTPGDWEPVTLENGWSNLAGYIPAQVRILTVNTAQLVGHIEGGTVTDGTVIGTLASGYYNASYAHSFTANVLAGASAVSVAGAISGYTDENALTNGTITGYSDSAALPNGDTAGTSGEVNGGTAGDTDHTHSSGSYALSDGQHYHGGSYDGGNMSVTNSNHVHTNNSGNQASATPVNYNTVTLTLSTGGELTISNASSAATQLSFNETLPLVTS